MHSYSFSRMFRTFWKIRIGSSFSNGTTLWSLEWIHLRFASLIVLCRCWDARDKCRSAIWEMFFTKTLCQILKAVLRVNGLKPFAFFFSKINDIISNDNNIFSIFFFLLDIPTLLALKSTESAIFWLMISDIYWYCTQLYKTYEISEAITPKKCLSINYVKNVVYG